MNWRELIKEMSTCERFSWNDILKTAKKIDNSETVNIRAIQATIKAAGDYVQDKDGYYSLTASGVAYCERMGWHNTQNNERIN